MSNVHNLPEPQSVARGGISQGSKTKRGTPIALWLSLVLFILGITLTVTGAHRYLARHSAPLVVDPRAFVAGQPQLLPEDRQAIVKALRKSSILAGLLRDKPYQIQFMDPWTNADGNSLGAFVQLGFPHPTTVSGTWEALSYDCTERTSPPYKSRRYRARSTGTTGMALLVGGPPYKIVSVEPKGGHIDGVRLIDHTKQDSNQC